MGLFAMDLAKMQGMTEAPMTAWAKSLFCMECQLCQMWRQCEEQKKMGLRRLPGEPARPPPQQGLMGGYPAAAQGQPMQPGATPVLQAQVVLAQPVLQATVVSAGDPDQENNGSMTNNTNKTA